MWNYMENKPILLKMLVLQKVLTTDNTHHHILEDWLGEEWGRVVL